MQLDEPGRGSVSAMTSRSTCGWIRRPTHGCEALRGVDERTLADLIYEFGEEPPLAAASPGQSSPRAGSPRSRTRDSSQTSCGARFRARGTCESIRRRGRFRPFASGSTANSGARCVPRRGGTTVGGERANGPDHLPFAGGRIAKHTLRALQAEGFGLGFARSGRSCQAKRKSNATEGEERQAPRRGDRTGVMKR